jgi:hypothetical protein
MRRLQRRAVIEVGVADIGAAQQDHEGHRASSPTRPRKKFMPGIPGSIAAVTAGSAVFKSACLIPKCGLSGNRAVMPVQDWCRTLVERGLEFFGCCR